MKKLTLFALISVLSLGFVACGGDDDEKKANGETCEAADDCESNYCGEDKKCADKPADKKDNDAECTQNTECKSDFCSIEEGKDKGKCADKPATDDKAGKGEACSAEKACKEGLKCDDTTKKCVENLPPTDDKKANGEACEKADDCTSNFCGDDKKCADKPAEEKTIDQKIEEYCKKTNETAEQQTFCITVLKDKYKTVTEKMPNCKAEVEDTINCEYENIGKGDEACEPKDKVLQTCMTTKHPEEFFIYSAETVFCPEEVERTKDTEDAKTMETCMQEINEALQDQKTNYDKCISKYYPYMQCGWDNWELGDEEMAKACATQFSDYETCMTTNYPEVDA